LTKNESKNIAACLGSLGFCDQIVVVDDNSTDDTVKIAKKHGAQILVHALDGDFASQRNWALEEIKSNWILFVDADEIVSQALAEEIRHAVDKIDFKGYYLSRIDIMWGKGLKYGDLWHAKVLRLARRGAGIWVGKVHEEWKIEGRIGNLKNDLEHRPHQNMVEFLQHINLYSTLRAQEFFEQRIKTNTLEIIFAPILKFKYLYFLKFGFLDGTTGFIHAMTMAFYTFMVKGKLYLLYKGIPK